MGFGNANNLAFMGDEIGSLRTIESEAQQATEIYNTNAL
jgi:hypothetical protein